MRVYDGIEHFTPPPGGIALTIGNFDGVHRGHRALLRAAAAAARARGGLAVAMTFEPHPATVLAPHRAPPRLTTAVEKAELLGQAGADAVVILRSEPGLFSATAEEFLERYVRRCRTFHVVEGENFHFGKGRSGTIDTLRSYATRHGLGLTVVAPVVSAELPGNPTIDSSAIREALQIGRVEDAGVMLGRPHRVVGVVGHGESRGARLGFPTANVEQTRQLAPGYAVYAGIAQLASGERRGAVVNVGPQPTFGQFEARIEAHLLDYSGELRGQPLGLWFVSSLRAQRRFAGAAELIEQLRQDVARGREVLATSGVELPPLGLN